MLVTQVYRQDLIALDPHAIKAPSRKCQEQEKAAEKGKFASFLVRKVITGTELKFLVYYSVFAAISHPCQYCIIYGNGH